MTRADDGFDHADYLTIRRLRAEAADVESYCHRCHGPNVSWCASSPLWNAVMRRDPTTLLWKEIICPTCFAVLAEAAGVALGWRLSAATVNVELATVLSDGRVWDEEAELWTSPVPTEETE